MAGMSSNERTLKLMRDLGWLSWKVEQAIPVGGGMFKRRDMFGIIDILSISPMTTLGVQACGTDFAPHVDKLCDENAKQTVDWLGCRGRQDNRRRLIIVGWNGRKLLKRDGTRSQVKTWTPRIEELKLEGDGFISTTPRTVDSLRVRP